MNRPLGLRIALIEDSDTDAELLRFEIASAWPDADVEVIVDGSAFAAWLAAAQCPDIVLCDSRLPGLHGGEAFAQLRTRWPDCPFVFCVGALRGDPLLESVLAQADDVVDKNDMGQLVPVMRRVLEQRAIA